jgi:hypothetical protein
MRCAAVKDQFSFALGTVGPHNMSRSGYVIQLSGIDKKVPATRNLGTSFMRKTFKSMRGCYIGHSLE